MTPLHLAGLIASIATAICAFIASWFWYLSSRPTPEMAEPLIASIADVPAQFILGAQADIYSIRDALRESSRLNKCAAIWSALAALFGAISAVLSIV